MKAFERAGWVCAKALAKDKHFVLHNPGFEHHLSIPKHKEVKRALLQKQIRLAGLSDQQYCDYFEGRA